ncbi:MAG: glycosyltransferase family 2 protein [Chloroflexi bacterium]|nr:glycosyltransferase family 2 protein [Chloroflexota bacterium]
MTTVDVVIPVYNEEKALPGSIAQLRAFLATHIPHRWRIVIADNASLDRTPEVGRELAARFTDVDYLRLEQKGRGRALRTAWLASDADVLSYMDVDLSTNLAAFPPLIEAIVSGGYDLAIGSRLMPASRTTRSLKREVISRGYNMLIKLLFWNHFSDAQCGFKAITRQAAHQLVPLVQDQSWFFDTELLLRAEQYGYRIAEVPVEWIEDLDSRVKIVQTAIDDVRGLLRVRFGPSPPFKKP